MDNAELGLRLRRHRAALGSTVASVAAEAGLSVPYVANLENGRGNPTVAVLDRLAIALGLRLVITFTDPATDAEVVTASPPLPPSLLKFSQTLRFQREVDRLASLRHDDDRRIRAMLIDALAALAYAFRFDLPETEWRRLLDTLVLILGHPAAGD